jgi:hypothetical protein
MMGNMMMRWFACIFVCGYVHGASVVLSVDPSGNGDCTSISSCLLTSSAVDVTLNLVNGIFLGRTGNAGIVINGSRYVTINGGSLGSTVSLEGSLFFIQLYDEARCVVSHVTVRNLHSSTFSAVSAYDSSALSLQKATFTHNISPFGGALWFNSKSILEVSDCTFSFNSAIGLPGKGLTLGFSGAFGGAIVLVNVPASLAAQFNKVTFLNNNVSSSLKGTVALGGAIFASNASLTLSQCTVKGNGVSTSADNMLAAGGAIAAVAPPLGGASFTSTPQLVVNGGLFVSNTVSGTSNNTVQVAGGAIFLHFINFKVVNAEFLLNSVSLLMPSGLVPQSFDTAAAAAASATAECNCTSWGLLLQRQYAAAGGAVYGQVWSKCVCAHIHAVRHLCAVTQSHESHTACLLSLCEVVRCSPTITHRHKWGCLCVYAQDICVSPLCCMSMQ